jgi:transposase InsO family protein
MPWQEVDRMSLKTELVMLAQADGANMAELSRRFGVSRKTAYKWLDRYREYGVAGLEERSRRPSGSPWMTEPAMEKLVVALRKPQGWGGRKIARRLSDLGHQNAPAPSTITGILRRHGLLNAEDSERSKAWIRFEHPYPNALWQMDFKGHFALPQGRCHPLTVLDDHSRFNVVLRALDNERGAGVQATLIDAFRRYGLPERMTMDNGKPWGHEPGSGVTALKLWWIRLGIRVSHSRPYHPQTQGKDERFHRTLKAELLKRREFVDLMDCQRAFDGYRNIYNLQRPHEAIELATPITRYCQSPRPYPERLPTIDYGPADQVRKVQHGGELNFKGRQFKVSSALHGYPVALRPSTIDGCYNVYFCHHRVAEIDFREPV